MSNRFHNKFHRHNHHTERTVLPAGRYPDSSYDPIASRESPFKGEFYSEGQITSTQTISAGTNIVGTTGVFKDCVIQTNLFSQQNAQFEDLNVEGTLIASNRNFPFIVEETTVTRTFSAQDTNKVIHFNGTTPISAVLPANLPPGFNVYIVNIGTNVVSLSTGTNLQSAGRHLTTQYSWAQVYKPGSFFSFGDLA